MERNSAFSLITYPHPVLMDIAEKINLRIFPKSELSKIIHSMYDVMHQHQGCGLAAPQIGKSLRIIVIEPILSDSIFINPEIIYLSANKKVGAEGCLSLPGVTKNVSRSTNIVIHYQNTLGTPLKLKVDNEIAARIIQHEIDHLNGKLIIDEE